MALVWADGFDQYSTTADMGNFWTTPGNPNSSHVRTGTNALNSRAQLTIAAQASYVAGVAAFNTANSGIAQFDTSTGTVARLQLNNSGQMFVQYWDNTGVHTVTDPSAINPNVFNYFELKVTNAGTGAANGTITVHFNGANRAALALTSLNLRDSGGTGNTNQIDSVSICYNSTGNFDDFYLCDLTGGANNDFLGPIACYTLTPSANGNTQQWATNTPNTGANEYKNVNEATPDYDTSYNATGTVGLIDDYAFSNASIPATQALQGVMAFAVAKNDLAGTAGVAPYIEQAAATSTGSTTNLSTSYSGVAAAYDKNPCTAANWVRSDINALSAGLKRTV